MVQLSVNGQLREVARAITIDQLLVDMKLRPSYVAVELNGRLIPRQQHAEQLLQEGDRLEVVTLVGGG